jgi:thiamine pyrophosphokinase
MENDDMHTISIVAGGPESLLPDTFETTDNRITYIGVDEGVRFLLKRGIRPDAAFGDFDSISSEEVDALASDDIKTFTFQREKDMTDLELAFMWAIEQKPTRIQIYGATGGRLDHELINVQMLTRGLDSEIDIAIIDRRNIIFLKLPGTYPIEKDGEIPYVSFLPFSGMVKGITLEGFKYPLDQRDLELGSTLCISNELVTKKGTYSFDDGIIMVIRSKD